MPADLSIEELSAAIKEKALELGFSGCGFSRTEALPEDALRLEKWLQQGYHAHMAYMANHFEKTTINLVFEPQWDKSMLSEEAKLELGLL